MGAVTGHPMGYEAGEKEELQEKVRELQQLHDEQRTELQRRDAESSR